MGKDADAIADVVDKVAQKLNEALSKGQRSLVIVRCASLSVVDSAREAIRSSQTPFTWRTLPISDLDPPDLAGYLLHAGRPSGPAFLAYGLPRELDGSYEQEFFDLLSQRASQYSAQATLAVLLLTVEEMKVLARRAPDFWRLRHGLVGWPASGGSSRYLPATVAGGLADAQGGGVAHRASSNLAAPSAGRMAGRAVGGVAGQAASHLQKTFASGVRGLDSSGIEQSPENTPWAGSPFTRQEEDVPEYFKDSPAPAGRRWGTDLSPDDEALAESIDAARDLLERGETEIARRQLAKAAKQFRGTGNALGCAECYVLLGRAAEIRVDYRVAYDWYKAALDVYEQIEDFAGFSDCAGLIGYLRFLHGDGDGALRAFKRALDRDESSHDQLRMAHGYRRIGIISEAAQQFAAAADQFEKAANLEERNLDRRAYSRSLNHLARIARITGDFEQAARLLEESLALKEDMEDLHGLSSGFHELGNLRLQDQKLEDALAAYEQALQYEAQTRDLPGLAATHAQIGLVHKELFAFKDAVRALYISQELFIRLDSPNASAITPVLEAAGEMVDAWEVRTIEEEVQQWLEEVVYRMPEDGA